MKKSRDRELGMNRGITRRDILHGAGALAAAGLIPASAFSKQAPSAPRGASGIYPPGLTGLRGSHVGSFEVAHELARDGRTDWGPVDESESDIYDLVIVGAGLSGLSAAHFYRKSHPDARILILDNHDDFGGHAKRNEFEVGGRNIIGYGGSQTLEEPSSYGIPSKTLLKDLGVDLDFFNDAYDGEFFRRNGLAGAVFFDKANWGADRLVHYDLGSLRYTLPLEESPVSVGEAVKMMPMSAAGQAEMLRLLTTSADAFPGMNEAERWEAIEDLSYRDYLSEQLDVSEPEVFAALQALTTDLSAGIESVSAIDALEYIGLPGANSAGLFNLEDAEPYIHHFLDGNASIARMIVRNLIPDVAPGSTMHDIVRARFDYSKLDVSDAPARIRLNSTVVDVRHEGEAGSAKILQVNYVRDGKHAQVKAKHCIMACYNAIIPSVCKELPTNQKEALSGILKTPIMYTNVVVNNWRAWQSAGIGAVSMPTGYHVNAMLDFPINMGGYEFADSPDDPMIVHMERFPHMPNQGLSMREQAPIGRAELLTTSFETIERHAREQLASLLQGHDFDPARDIEAITVNRWPHGYATRDWLEDDYYEDRLDKRYPHIGGRQPFGRIAIANSDSQAQATFDAAVDQAYRAVSELA
ncbi:MAG: NAD(P)/FAD-dependent oxidoreductase [Gammaproteobacteria bacterium]|nr:NAD(P)/FAD-dependent oxidoreductase [Gammaproteobacteria bacterium]